MEFVLDERTIRVLTHLPATAMVQCDLVWPDHSPVVQSPRAILQHQLDRCAERGWTALSGHRAGVHRLRHDLRAGRRRGYRDLTPVNQYNVDYSILGTTRVEPLLRAIRNHMYDAGLDVEGAKGECNFGQHEIGFLYADAMTTADNHAVYKTAAKEIAAQQGKSITFMAKYDEREGSSCHIHLSLRGTDGALVFWDEDGGRARRRSTTTSWPGCSRRSPTSRCSTRPTSTPTSASRTGSFAPTTIAWGLDNRTCAVRLVGHGAGARMENRVPGADANPYLALAAMLAGGLHGIEQELTARAGAGRQRLHLRRRAGAGARCWPPGRPFATSRAGPRGLRRRGRRPLRQHGRRRAGGLQRRRHRLGAAAADSRGCEHRLDTFTVVNPATEQAVVDVPLADLAGDRRRDRRRARGVPVLAARRARASGPPCCAASPPSSTPTSRSSPSSRSATPATRGATPAGRPATSATA